jgi:hypothetical protein
MVPYRDKLDKIGLAFPSRVHAEAMAGGGVVITLINSYRASSDGELVAALKSLFCCRSPTRLT